MSNCNHLTNIVKTVLTHELFATSINLTICPQPDQPMIVQGYVGLPIQKLLQGQFVSCFETSQNPLEECVSPDEFRKFMQDYQTPAIVLLTKKVLLTNQPEPL